MKEHADFLPKYLYRGSPFLPRISLAFRIKVIIDLAKGNPLPLAAALDLRERYLSHFQKLIYNHIIPRDFEMPRESLEHYKLGFLVPTVVIQSSIQKRRGIIYSYANDFSFTNDLVAFILDKVISCDSLRRNKAPWKEVFQILRGYEDSVLYIVGITALEHSFTSLVGRRSA